MNQLKARFWVNLALLWLAGNCLRMTILAVPPLLPSIHRELHLTEVMVGALISLPVVLLAIGAIPGSLLIARIGARRVLILGLLLVAAGGAGRGVASSAFVLFGMSVVMGIGIAISQPALPSLVQQWCPGRTVLATALYSNGFLVGEILAASLTIPVVLPLVRHSWQLVLPLWSVPVLLTAMAIGVFTPHLRRKPDVIVPAWWPDWGSSLTWRLGLILGCASTTYFGSNAFIPDYLKATHESHLISLALTTLNLSQLPASLLVGATGNRLVGRRWPIVASGAGIALTSLFLLRLGGMWVVTGAAVLGFCSGSILVLTLALPPIMAEEHDVHRLSAAMFTVSYACSFIGSLLGGAAWDVTGAPLAAFTPVVVAGACMTALVIGLSVRTFMIEPAPPAAG